MRVNWPLEINQHLTFKKYLIIFIKDYFLVKLSINFINLNEP